MPIILKGVQAKPITITILPPPEPTLPADFSTTILDELLDKAKRLKAEGKPTDEIEARIKPVLAMAAKTLLAGAERFKTERAAWLASVAKAAADVAAVEKNTPTEVEAWLPEAPGGFPRLLAAKLAGVFPVEEQRKPRK